MAERLQQDSEMPLEKHKETMVGMLADTIEKATGEKINHANGENPVLSEMGGFASSFMSSTGSNDSNGIFLNMKKASPNSMFFGHGGAGGKAGHRRESMVPMGYAEKKAQNKMISKNNKRALAGKKNTGGDVFANSQIASLSLTGGSATGGKPTPIKGVSLEMARMVGAGWMLDELDFTNKVIKDPYEAAPKRLLADLNSGQDGASKFLQQKPEVAIEMARNMNPDVAAEVFKKVTPAPGMGSRA
jgi:hypothetical protein